MKSEAESTRHGAGQCMANLSGALEKLDDGLSGCRRWICGIGWISWRKYFHEGQFEVFSGVMMASQDSWTFNNGF